MDSSERAQEILIRLRREYPSAHCELVHDSAWQLLVATMLSAQSTDARVNMVTPELFLLCPTPLATQQAKIEDIKRIIYSTGFYNNKANNIKNAAEKILTDFSGFVPDNMADLITLPGVARKTANVLLWVWFHKNEGIAVDTHVMRLAYRYGLTQEPKNPDRIEKDLMKIVPEKDWGNISTLLIHHGRAVATARNPRDEMDVLKEFIISPPLSL